MDILLIIASKRIKLPAQPTLPLAPSQKLTHFMFSNTFYVFKCSAFFQNNQLNTNKLIGFKIHTYFINADEKEKKNCCHFILKVFKSLYFTTHFKDIGNTLLEGVCIRLT